MPYEIKRLPNSTKYEVKLKNTKEILSKHTTLKNAHAQIRAIEMHKHKNPMV
jgi:hypothetical protein